MFAVCKKYAESVYIPVGEGFGGKVTKYDSCAASEPLISQGRDAKPKEFPHMASKPQLLQTHSARA